ncbi:MAG: acetoacetyl-CoA synthase [Myxococcales bacterium]|nr:acetoacetyl-CoA synthase [Myxococcales bacterium]
MTDTLIHTHSVSHPDPAHPATGRAPRRAVNVTVSVPLLAEARHLGIPLSATLEEALRLKVRAAREAEWLRQNAGSVADYNERVDREGTFGGQFGNL